MGNIIIKMNDCINQAGISKNKLAQRAQIQFSQISSWSKNETSRIDIDVLRRICDVFSEEIPNFHLEDLIEYTKEESR